MNVLVVGDYRCGECGQPLVFEPVSLTESQPFAFGSCPNRTAFSSITGDVLSVGCARADVRIKVIVPLIDCELSPLALP